MVISPILKTDSDISIEKLVVCHLDVLLMILSHKIVWFKLVEKRTLKLNFTIFSSRIIYFWRSERREIRVKLLPFNQESLADFLWCLIMENFEFLAVYNTPVCIQTQAFISCSYGSFMSFKLEHDHFVFNVLLVFHPLINLSFDIKPYLLPKIL
jgi:hypothetical protein